MKNSLHFSGMYKALWGVLFLLFALTSSAQTTIFQEDFEGFSSGVFGTTTIGGWTSSQNFNCDNKTYWGVYDINYNINGNSLQASRASSNTSGCGVIPGNYTNRASDVYVFATVDASGYENITMDFDYRVQGEQGFPSDNDYGQIIYRVGTTGTWLSVNEGGYFGDGYYTGYPNPTHQSIVLPNSVEDNIFQFGFKWVNNNSTQNQPAFVVDNIIIKGQIPCTSITATVSTPVICEGDETTLSVSGQPGYTYNWYLNYDSSSNTGDFVGTGSSITVSPEESTLYAVVSNCGTYDFVSVVINPPPTAIVQSPIEVNNCESEEIIHELTVDSGGVIPNVAFSETFNPGSPLPWVTETSVIGGAGPSAARWKIYNSSGTFHSSDNSDFAMVDSDDYGNYYINSKLISPVFSLADYSDASLSFEHHYLHFSSTAKVEISTDMGENWTSLATYNTNQGSATSFQSTTINLNAYAGQPAVMIRFNYEATYGWYWAVDNITVTGTPKPTTFTWSPIEGLYTDAAATTPYTGEDLDTVYAMPENGGTYTVTATSSVGCATTAEIEIIGGISIWNGTSWANNTSPNNDRKAVFRGDYNSTGDIEACSCLVESGNVVINSNDNLIVHNGLEVNSAGSLTIKSDANLLQINPAENIGVITVEREANVPFNQYNFWSSPVVGQNLYTIYPNIPDNRVMTYNTDDDYYTIVPNPTTADFGIGYSIKGPSSDGPAVTSRFIGVPHNETLTGFNSIPLNSSEGQGFNLIGNPYPSNLNIQQLYDANNTVIDPSFYFWDNTNNTVLTQQGSDYSGVNFAVYNANFEDGTHAATNGDSDKEPNGIVKPGQGFLVQAISGSSLEINNSMRTIATKINAGDGDAPYYKNGGSSQGEYTGSRPKEGKYWLELVTEEGVEIQIAIGYFADADSDFDKFDTSVVNESASDNLYSYSADAAKLTINGRSAFSDEDVVLLGLSFFEYGKYKIKLGKTKGIFNTHQTIYLKDKYLNIIHNLSTSEYEFEGQEGEFTDRFEILYTLPSNVAELTTASMNQLKILQLNEEILISSSKDKILEVEVFNLAGWSVYQKANLNANEWRIPTDKMGEQILIVNVLTETGEVVSEKLIKK